MSSTIACALLLACGGAEGGSDAGAASQAEPSAASTDAEGPPSLTGRAAEATAGIPSIILLTPVDGTADRARLASHGDAPATGDEAVVDQFGLAFSPRVLIVAHGEPVRFTNSEGAISHNVHLRSVAGDSTVFNGDTGPGEGVDVALPAPGGYDVLCNMHPGMTGFVFVTDAPLAVAAETDGRFRFSGLPAGEYEARAWTVASGFGDRRRVTVTDEGAEVDLTSSQPVGSGTS